MIFIKRNNTVVLTLVSVIFYFLFAYFLERAEFNKLFILYLGLFYCFYFLIQKHKNNFSFLVIILIFFRLIFLFAIPNLSQDFYRFIWDGRMIFEGLNPYLSLPETFINQQNYPVNQAIYLYSGMGDANGSHYTNYPPINQFCFFIAALFANKSILGSVIVMRILIILSDIGIIYFGRKLLKKLNIPTYNIFWYALNPLIIIELTGNLHFESVMIFFLVWSLYKLYQQKWIWAAILLACSVSVKLIPLLFLPLFYQWFIKKKLAFRITNFISFYAIIFFIILLLFAPFYSPYLLDNYFNSIGLWFRSFEFNASLYYVFREIGYLFRGYNEIAVIGKIIPILTTLFLVIITFFRKNNTMKQLITALLFGLSFYYFTTTTFHPWYLSTLIILSVFTKYRFPIVWSLVIILSYSAYSINIYKENLWLVSLEYLIVYGFLIYELYIKKIIT